jgi:putative endonuclease
VAGYNPVAEPSASYWVILFNFGFESTFIFYWGIKYFKMEHPKFAVYVLYSLKDHLFYIGYTANFIRRMSEHENGRSKSTACRRPFVCVFVEYYVSQSDALRRELYFKTSMGKRVLRLMLTESLLELDKTLNRK